MNQHKFPYKWDLATGYPPLNKGEVFTCFACGGGSTMGYKLAGFNVIGMNEIDPKIAEVYIKNHNPKFCFIEPIQSFSKRETFPIDYDFNEQNVKYICGMSIPPLMTAQIATRIHEQWLSKL